MPELARPSTKRFGAAAALALVLASSAASMAACAAPAPPAADGPAPAALGSVAPVDDGKVLNFSVTALDGTTVTTDSVAGRTTLIAFLTEYDNASVGEAEFLNGILKKHVPRINVVALFLEREENRPLVKGAADGLHLHYPVCLADADTIAGVGTFAGMNSVPSFLILDKAGHEKLRYVGFLTEEQLDAAIKSVE